MIVEMSTRQMEIIDAAGKILTNSGVSGLTIKNLAKEMHFSEAALYRHFSSKEEIIIAMLNFLAENMDQRYTDALVNEKGAVDKFKTIFQNQFAFFSKNPHFVVAVFSDGLMEESEGINRSIQNIMQVKIKHLMPIILVGQQNGDFTNAISKEELIHVVMGTFRLLMFKWRLSDFTFDIQKHGEKMTESVLTLIQTK